MLFSAANQLITDSIFGAIFSVSFSTSPIICADLNSTNQAFYRRQQSKRYYRILEDNSSVRLEKVNHVLEFLQAVPGVRDVSVQEFDIVRGDSYLSLGDCQLQTCRESSRPAIFCITTSRILPY